MIEKLKTLPIQSRERIIRELEEAYHSGRYNDSWPSMQLDVCILASRMGIECGLQLSKSVEEILGVLDLKTKMELIVASEKASISGIVIPNERFIGEYKDPYRQAFDMFMDDRRLI